MTEIPWPKSAATKTTIEKKTTDAFSGWVVPQSTDNGWPKSETLVPLSWNASARRTHGTHKSATRAAHGLFRVTDAVTVFFFFPTLFFSLASLKGTQERRIHHRLPLPLPRRSSAGASSPQLSLSPPPLAPVPTVARTLCRNQLHQLPQCCSSLSEFSLPRCCASLNY